MSTTNQSPSTPPPTMLTYSPQLTSLDYVDIPSAATLLQSTIPLHRSLRPAPKIVTPLPKTTSPPSPTTRNRTNSMPGSPSLSILPQLLLSSTLPGGPSITGLSATPPTSPSVPSTHNTTSTNLRKRISVEPIQLMSTKDPLSVPIMSVNFRRFVSCVGPVFWLQDRIEEIVTWKKGWKVTCTWLSAYGFFCYFPQLLLCLPHIAIISIILATYPYPAGNGKDGGGINPDQPLPTEGSIPWQANIQGIQNLMGTFSDVVDFVKPYLHHLRLTPDHLYPDDPSNLPPSGSTSSNLSSSNSGNSISSESSSISNPTADATDTSSRTTSNQKRRKQPSSPYTSHILTFLVVTLLPLAYIVSLPVFPLRFVVFLAGALPILGLHPWMQNVFLPMAIFIGEQTWNSPLPEHVVNVIRRVKAYQRRAELWINQRRWRRRGTMMEAEVKSEEEECEELLLVGKSRFTALKTVLQRVVDDDRLTDACWRSELREVELWENERYVGPTSPDSPSISSSIEPSLSRPSFASLTSLGSSPQRTRITSRAKGSWSKANLKPADRGPWTRRRDGWNGSSGQDGYDEEGEVNSSLTFPLAPGWAFVPTEDWRKDVVAEWALDDCGGGDEDGWVYTNDVWQDPRSSLVRHVPEDGEGGDATSGGPYVTRRRRWVRRIWFDPVRTTRIES